MYNKYNKHIPIELNDVFYTLFILTRFVQLADHLEKWPESEI